MTATSARCHPGSRNWPRALRRAADQMLWTERVSDGRGRRLADERPA
jgi:hypothetical protein